MTVHNSDLNTCGWLQPCLKYRTGFVSESKGGKEGEKKKLFLVICAIRNKSCVAIAK